MNADADASLLALFVEEARSAQATKQFDRAERSTAAGLDLGRSHGLEQTDEFTDLLFESARLDDRRGRSDATARTLAEALQHLEARGAATTERAASARHLLGMAEKRRGNMDAARAQFTAALQIRERQMPQDAVAIAQSLEKLASLAVSTQRFDEAVTLAKRGVALLQPGHLAAAVALSELCIALAEAQRARNDLQAAEKALELGVQHLSHYAEQERRLLVDLLSRLSAVKESLGNRDEAVVLLQKALALADVDDRGGVLPVLASLIALHDRLKDYGAADELVRRFVFVQRRHFPDGQRFVTEAPGSEPQVQPKAAQVSKPRVGGNVAHAAGVVARLRGGFTGCYQTVLNDNPVLAGHMRLTFHIRARGDVDSVRAQAIGFPIGVVDCVLGVAGPTVFDPPEGGWAVVNVPVTFVKQAPN